MRIGIDARWIFSQASGITVYTEELIKALVRLDTENEYVLFFNSRELCEQTFATAHVSEAANFSHRIVPWGVFSPASQFFLPGILTRSGIDVFHSPNYMIPFLAFPKRRPGRIRLVVTIHDVIPLIFPHHAPRSKKSRLFPIYRKVMLESGARADIIVADSNAAMADVVKHLKIGPDREGNVRAIYCGVCDRFSPSGTRAKGEGSSGGSENKPRTVLYVGRPDPYKNCVRLVEAFALAKQRCTFPLDLMIVGPEDERYPEAGQKAAELGIRDAVRWVYLSDGELVGAYRAAGVVVLPSLYEGFGLPVAEAMACGVPVVCSDRGALPEVAGDAALQVDPENTEAIAAAITRALVEPQLASELSAKGLAQAAKFTWERTARETLRAYREAVDLA
jgi:glycosyltransferase involved in cell wall biosynthesis